jgi:ADP-ribosylglycohydrolase
MSQNADQNRFLGTLIGMAIGDALGMPVAGWPAERIRKQIGSVDDYHRRVFDDGAEIKAGEFTDESEIALCIVEATTANGGVLDPDLIGPRMLYLARGESKRWMHADTLAALGIAEDSLDFSVPLNEDGPSTGDVALRGVPVGLIHSVGAVSEEKLKQDAEIATRLTHGSPRAIASVAAVAQGVMLAARHAAEGPELAVQTAQFLGGGSIADALDAIKSQTLASSIAALGDGNDAAAVIGTGFAAAIEARTFEEAVFRAVNAGGAADSRGALAGALAGARFGASGIPQELIDHLEGRIYISLAAPWFYKTAMRRAGLLIDLQPS